MYPPPALLLAALIVSMSACVTNDQARSQSGECNVYSDQRTRLRAFDPYLLPNLRSTGGGDETAIVFVNCTGSEISYYWIDRDGVERYYGRIEPESDAIQHSFEGHIWVVKTGDGVNLSVFRASRAMSLAFVTPETPRG